MSSHQVTRLFYFSHYKMVILDGALDPSGWGSGLLATVSVSPG